MAADRVEIKWGKFGLGQNCRLLLSRLCKRGLAPLYKNEALVECSQGFIERGKFVEARSTLTYYPFRFSGEDPGFKLICDAH